MYILGIDCYYHDSAACLLKDGSIVAAVEEERLSRKKHDSGFPILAVDDCLKSQKITIEDIDYIGFYEKPLLKFERVLWQHLAMFPKSYLTFVRSMPSWVNQKLHILKHIRKKLKFKKDVLFLEHHLAHAASVFLPSPFEEAAIVTVDGVGEWTTTAYGMGKGNDIHLNKEIRFPHSLGLLYSTITAYLGFSVNNSEYKVMGLSPCGDQNPLTNPFYKKLRQVIDIKEDGSYRLDLSYFLYHYKHQMPAQKLCDLLGGPIFPREGLLTDRHKDIAAALQMITEETLTLLLRYVYQMTHQKKLVMAGGVALNSVYNGKILEKTPFKDLWIQPNASDGGSSMGAACYIYHSLLGHPRTSPLKSAYLGSEFNDQEIQTTLDQYGIRYHHLLNDDDICCTTAKLIYENKVIGWSQGRMEWGPRALGGRSILANPCHPEMQKILNEKVKHREPFRPFAPVVCAEDAPIYFECPEPVPAPSDYMLMVYPIRKEYRKKIPAVTHVDGSGRVQTVHRHQHPLYYDTIKEFGKLSGIPMLVNTSFNIRGEPIVCNPYDAYKCMMGTSIDSLVIGHFLIHRQENLQHIWNSEEIAKD